MIQNPGFIAEIISRSIITAEDYARLSVKHKGDDFSVLMHLFNGAARKKEELGKLWSDSLGVAYVDLAKTLFQSNVVEKLPEKFARMQHVIPLYEMGDVVTVATSNPSDRSILREAGNLLGRPVSPVFSFPGEIEDAISIQYQSNSALGALLGKISANSLFKSTSKISMEQLRQLAGDQSITELARCMMLLAVKERASDIHVEPGEEAVRIRFRIDGILHERLKLDSTLLPPLVTRIKVLSNMDITERRRPQDGRMHLDLTNRSIDIRVSIIPILFGEKVVLRILGQTDVTDVPSLSDLMLSRSVLDMVHRILSYPHGVFFVTGPTGSGKTTTLYAALKHINKPGSNIVTIEDPVEIRLPGINQVQVNRDVGLDFASALRAFLRQDPDVILLGEIRDTETAKIAAQAALTGHLVLATMHTNDALQAVTRLIDIGVDPFLVAPSIIGTMAQRLVRRLCDGCKERYRLSDEEAGSLFTMAPGQEVYFHRARGCERCSRTGYFGRIAVHEIFVINDQVRTLIARNPSIQDIKDFAARSGFQNLRYDGIKKVLRGLTTIEEIDRITVFADEN